MILPYYSFMDQKWKDMLEYRTNFYMDFNWNRCYVGIFECVYEGIHYYFIDNQDYFTDLKPYNGMPYDLGRFAFFDKAALSILPTIDFRPDVIHCHDWQTGLIPVYLNSYFQENEFYRGIKTVMTIHNLKFQGIWDVKTMKDIVEKNFWFDVADDAVLSAVSYVDMYAAEFGDLATMKEQGLCLNVPEGLQKNYPEGLSGYQQHGLKIEKTGDDSFRYTYVSIDEKDRNFPERLYRFPMPESELSSNALVEQYDEWK